MLPDCVIGKLVEHYTGIAEVMIWIQIKPEYISGSIFIPAYSQTKWSVPLKIALMNWLFETWTR